MRHKVTDAGVVLVESLEELVDASQLLVRCDGYSARGPAILTESGAFKAIALDLCESLSLEVPALSEENETKLRAAMPAFIPPSNPLDLTAHALVDPDLYRRTLQVFAFDDRFGSLILSIILTDAATASLKFPHLVNALRDLRAKKPVLFAAMDEGAQFPYDYVRELRGLGVPFFPSPERAFRALARVGAVAGVQANIGPREEEPLPATPEVRGELPEYRSKQVLAEIGIPIPRGELAKTLAEARRIAEEIGFPVALKIQSVDLPHKSDVGGVVLHVRDAAELERGWEQVRRAVQEAAPGAHIDGVLVESMGARGVELIVGARNDAEWGPVLLAGLGGVLAEVMQDVRLLSPGLSVEALERELHRLEGAALLRGYRGSAAADVRAAAEVLHKLGLLVRACPQIVEIDINPLVVYPAGQGALALDALIVADEE
jgi:acyl-CoA synthetase (NDP forming)